MQRRQRQISFAQPLNNYLESNSRQESPSIAIEQSQLIQKHNAINISPIRNAHFRYLVHQGKKRESREEKQNVDFKNKGNQRTDKHKKIINYCQNINRTPLRNKDNNAKHTPDAQYSNTSSIKDQKTSSPFLKEKPPLKISHLNSNFHHQRQEHTLPFAFQNLMETVLSGTGSQTKRINSPEDLIDQNVDEEIYKLQRQIQQLKQMKRSMNNGVRPKDPIKDSTIQSIIESQFTDSNVNRNKCESTIKSFTLEGSMIKSQIVTFKQRVNQQDVKMPKILKKPSKRNKDEKQVKTLESSVQISPSLFTQTVKISEHREQRAVFSPGNSNQLRRLLSNFETQIKLDDKLRKAKKWFQRWRNESKWSQIQSLLKRSRYQMNTNTIKQIFNISSQEQNPFYTAKEDDFTLNTFIQLYEQAQNYWRKNMVGNFSQQGLASGCFIQEKMDISRRGSIQMEDLVRYVNYELDSAYRNRDIYLIYHRFKKGDVLLFRDIVELLTKSFQ